MALFDKLFRKKKDEEESTAPSSSTRVKDAVQNLYQQSAAFQQQAVQADMDVARAGTQRAQNAAKDMYAAYAAQQEAAAREKERQDRERIARQRELERQRQEAEAARLEQERAAREEQQKKLAEATQNIYSAVKQKTQNLYSQAQEKSRQASERMAENTPRMYGTAREFLERQDDNTGTVANMLQEREQSSRVQRALQDIMDASTRQQEEQLRINRELQQEQQEQAKQAAAAAFNAIPGQLAKNFAVSDEEAMRNTLRQAGYGEQAIDEGIESGLFNPTARYDRQQTANFGGQAAANYNLGELQQEANILLGQGIIRGDQDMIERGMELRDRAAQYQQVNEAALEYDSGTVGNMIARDFAQYLPQFTYQQMAALPTQPLAMLGQYGEAAAQAFGSGSLSYSTMAGAAYADMIENGADPEAAVQLAKDEAALSSVIEYGDTFLDWAFGLGSGLNPFKGMTKNAAKNMGGEFVKGLMKYVGNAGQEYGEEFVQELISMANERRLAEGNTAGGIPELLQYVMDEAKIQAPDLYTALKDHMVTQDVERLHTAGKGGAAIALVGGGLPMAYKGIRNIRTNEQRNQVNQAFDAIVEDPETEALNELTEEQLDAAAETARAMGRTDAAQILEAEAERRAEETAQETEQPAEEAVPEIAPDRQAVIGEAVENLQEQANTTRTPDERQKILEEFYENMWKNETDQEVAFVDPNGEPMLWDTRDQNHDRLLGENDWSDRDGTRQAIADGYIRVKQGQGIELAIDNGLLSPQQAKAIRNIADNFTGDVFHIDLDVADDSNLAMNLGTISIDAADLDGRTVVDRINSEIRKLAQQQAQQEAAPAQETVQPEQTQETVRETETQTETTPAQEATEEPQEDLRQQLAQAEQEYMNHSQANDTEYDYRVQMDKIDGLRRQIQEQQTQQTVNENADNVSKKNDNVNPTVEAMKQEGKVTTPTYDVDKYGDPHPERGEMGDDGVRICKDSDALEAELTDFYAGKIRNDTGEYMARIRRKNEGGYLLTINRDGKRDLSRTFGTPGEAAAFAGSYIDGQTQARTDEELDQNRSAPTPQQTAAEAAMTGTIQDEAARQKKNKAAELGTQALRERIRKADEEIKALRRLEKTTGLTDTQKEHMADVRETLETLNDELTSRKGRAKEKKEKVEVKGNKPTQSIADARRNLMNKFSIPEGRRTEVGNAIQQRLDEMISKGSVTEESRRALFDTLIDAGVVPKQADSTLHEIRNDLANRRIYVNEQERADLGENWDGLRKRAWGDRIFLTSDPTDTKIDAVNMELADVYGEKMFPTDVALSDMLENMLDLAAKGRTTQQSLSQAISDEARYTGATTDEIYDEMFRDMDDQLKAFGEKAGLEVDLKDRTASMLATERKRWEDRMDRQSQRRRESEIREKTMKAIKRLSKLRGKAAPDVRTEIDAALKDIDTHARQLTISGLEDLQELERVYEEAKKAAGYEGPDNPGNFISNPYIEEKLSSLTKKHINDMDIQDVIELGRVVSALETTVQNQNKLIGDEFDQSINETAAKVNKEVQQAKGVTPGVRQTVHKWLAEEHLSPRRFLNMLGGWKDGAMAKLADSLENGQTKMLDFQRRAVQSMDPFMQDKKNKQWLKTASGKNAKWYQYSVANGLASDGSGITGQTIEITPMQKVSLYLASLNEDNLRHIQTGGLRIPNKNLYMKGDIKEAYSQGTDVKMQPEAVRAIASTLTPEEKTFASYLQKFFNKQSKDAINEVSMQLDGYERADVDQYFPIESVDAYIKSDVEKQARSQTVEGIGSIANERVHAGNPIVLRDAYDVFMDQVDKVSRYYGYAIPIRDFNAINNHVFHEEGNAFAGSIKDTINHKWGSGAEKYITKLLQDIQGGQKSGSKVWGKLRSNLAGANLTLNPSVAASQLASYPAAAQSVGIKGLVGGLTAQRRLSDVSENQIDMAQLASYPGAAQVVGWDALAAGLTANPVDEKLVEKYTPLLWYRSQGYSSQEIGDAVAADKKNAAQKLLASKTLNWIQGMDRLATKRLWAAAEYKVRKDNPDLKPGSREQIDSGMDPYYREVAKVYNRAIYDTQPNYTDMERAQILRTDSDIMKFLTMYKTVPVQYYNMLAEAAGKLQAARQSGDSKQIANATKYALNTVAGFVAANGIYDVIKAAFKGLRGKDDDYRDEEGNLTIDTVLKQLGKDFMETNVGSIIGGAEMWSVAEHVVTGNKWKAPEINVLSAVQDTINDFTNVWKARSDGDEQKAAKALKETATDLASMLGLPVRNVETYLLSGIRWASPETALAYDNIFGGISKGDLKGMDPNVAGTAANMIMKNRTGVNLERAATDELSRLYAAGFSDAIPNATPDSFSYGGNEVKVKDKKAYSKTWGDVVSDNLEELISTKEYQDADDKTKNSMIKKLYQYATVQARKGADSEYEPDKSDGTYGWTLKADEAMDAGMDLPTSITAMNTIKNLKDDKNALGAVTTSRKSKVVAYIDSLPIDSEQKDLLYEQEYDSGLEMTPWHSGIDAQTAFTDTKTVADAGTQQTVMQSNLDSLQTSDYYITATAEEKKDLINKLQKYAETQGKKKTDPNYKGAGWTSWTEQAVKEGMTLPEALNYVQQLDGITADYDEYGDAISGTKKEKTLEYIDGLNISDKKKELLYRYADLNGSPVDYRTKKQTVEKYQKDLQKSDLYRSGTKEEQKTMNKRLDQYALVQAAKARDPNYKPAENGYGWTDWADQAVKAGMSLPEAIGYMTKVKGISSDYDEFGKAVKDSKKEKTLKYIDGLNISDKQKNLLYKIAGYNVDAEDLRTRKTIVENNRTELVKSKQYKNASTEDQESMLKMLDDYAKVQSMKNADKNYSPAGTSYAWTEWADQAVKEGMTLPEAIGYAQQVKSIKADYDQYGRAISGTKKEKTLEFIDGLNLPDDKEELLYKLAGYDSDGPALDYKTRKKVLKDNKDAMMNSDAYKNASAKDQKTMIKKLNEWALVQGYKKADKNYSAENTSYNWTLWADQAVKGGIDIKDAITYMTALSGMSADKDKYGKSITGSKKDKVCAYIESIPGLTTEQKDILYLYLYKENSLKYTPWHGYDPNKKKSRRRRGRGRRRSRAAKATSIKPVGQLAKGYDTSIDISTLFGTPAQRSGKSGDASAEDDLRELMEKYGDDFLTAALAAGRKYKTREKVDFRL